eukprot:10865407-Heterocapsa_arctica.AAC.1
MSEYSGLTSTPGITSSEIDNSRPRPPIITVQFREYDEAATISVIVQLQTHESLIYVRDRVGTFQALDPGHQNTFLENILLSPPITLETKGVLLVPTMRLETKEFEKGDVLCITDRVCVSADGLMNIVVTN